MLFIFFRVEVELHLTCNLFPFLLNAQIEQQRYENKIQLAREQNQPSIVMHEKRGDARAIALEALRQSSKVSY